MASMNDGIRPAAVKNTAYDHRAGVQAADEIGAEFLRRVADHYGVGKGPAQQVLGKAELLIKVCDGTVRGRSHVARSAFRGRPAAGVRRSAR